MIPQLRDVEVRFHDSLVIIGIHSAKYTTEGIDWHLEQAIQRLRIAHPVVNDRDMKIWKSFAVRAWPTLMFVSPDGQVIAKHEGEFDIEAMSQAIAGMLADPAIKPSIRHATVPALTTPEPLDSTLAFPTAVTVADEQLYVADTVHDRILVADLAGNVELIIGAGEPGFRDGGADQAQFHAPHGLAVHADQLYVADTENHAIRRIDLTSGAVMTIAGTGHIARTYESGGPALETSLRSPWDITVVGQTLYISMAGTHQLWFHGLGSDQVRRYAGTGHEGKRDGTASAAWLAQPSGIDSYAGNVVFCDAETSSIRTASARDTGTDAVTTLVGKDLFDWGDVDGSNADALLQHPTGVAYDDASRMTFIADTYNNKIKRIDPAKRTIETLAGDGSAGASGGDLATAQFFEPHGLDIAHGIIYVADTNNHTIRRIDLSNGVISTIQISI